jgi:hypothetical protein
MGRALVLLCSTHLSSGLGSAHCFGDICSQVVTDILMKRKLLQSCSFRDNLRFSQFRVPIQSFCLVRTALKEEHSFSSSAVLQYDSEVHVYIELFICN